MRRTLALAALLLAVLAGPAIAQGPERAFTFNRFRAHTTAGTYINGWDGELTPTQLTGRDASGEPILIPRTQLTKIEYEGGSQWGKGALIGGGTGFLIMGLAALQVAAEDEADPTIEIDWSGFPQAMALVTGIGAAIGALIGSQSPGWKTLDLRSP